ncbi:hypothetical protein FRC01_003542 [Tulasnella sp. 417]|nr:hypothetical protein FRC01_003542 [Tulasnella sp. 417]
MDGTDDGQNARDSPLSLGRQREHPLPWIVFGGSKEESSVDFIQLVQRLAFQRGQANDDEWIAQYASTCFTDDALIWYSNLESEERESWATLRLALLRYYPPPPKIRSFSTSSPSAPASRTQSFERIGIIKVLDKNSFYLGFVAFDRITGAAIIARELQKSTWVGLPRGGKSAPSQLYMMDAASDEQLPCLGVALLPSNSSNPNIAPQKLRGIADEYQMPIGRWRLTNVPQPSPRCRGSESPAPPHHSYTELATWVLAPCEEGTAPSYPPRSNPKPEERRAALVWHYIKDKVELQVKWVDEDGGECELGGFVHRDAPNELHFHRLEDMEPRKVKDFIQEDRVTFFLRPEDYPYR